MQRAGGELHCQKCGAKYAIKNDVPCFVVIDGAGQRDARIEKERAIRDREASKYNDVIAEFNRRLEKTRMRQAAKLNKQDVWLDAGCGIGDVLEKMHQSVQEIVACDYSLGSLMCLQERLKDWNREDIFLVEADLSNLPFCDESFSCVTSGQVLQHLPGRKMFQQALREIVRILRPGGRAVLTLFQFHPLQKAVFEKLYGVPFLKSGAWDNGLQFHRYSRPEIKNALAELECEFSLKTIKHLPDRLGAKLGRSGIWIDQLFSLIPGIRGLGSYFLITIRKNSGV